MGDRLGGAAVCLAGTVALLGALWKVLRDRGRRSGPPLHYGYVCSALIGAGMTVGAPAAAPVLCSVVPDPSHLALVADQLKVAASGALAMMAYSAWPAATARRAVRRQSALTAATVVLSTAVFLAASPVREGPAAGDIGAARPLLAAYVALFAVHTAWCLAVFGVLIGHSARCLPPGVLRLGLRLMALVALAGLLRTADTLHDLANVLAAGRESATESRVSGLAGAACVALGFAGAIVSAGTAWAGRVRAWRDHRRLGPLWSAIRAALPEIELVTPERKFGGGRGRRRGNLQFALYRRIIEIRDGQLSLRSHVHPAVPAWVGEVVGPAEAEELAAVVEAAAIAAALEAARAGHRFPVGRGEACVPHPVAADIREEAAWLVKVAAAYTGSPAVAHVRGRVRSELGGAVVRR